MIYVYSYVCDVRKITHFRENSCYYYVYKLHAMALFKILNIKDHKRFPVKRFNVWNPRKIIPANLTPVTAVAKLVIRCVLKV